jgi:RNA polymerase sigma factor (sigma-70 family)
MLRDWPGAIKSRKQAMRKYKNQAIFELASELCSALPRLRKGFLDAAEDLMQLINPDQEYPYDFVVFRLTAYRPKPDARRVLDGKALRSDLRVLMLDVSDSFELHTSDYNEKVYDTAAMARRFDVSTKTIQRWRQRGLPARRLIFPDGKRRIGFLDSSVEWFLHDHRADVQRSMKFSQLSQAERAKIIARARRMATFTNSTLIEIARRLARRTGRAVETIRYTIRKHDVEFPDQAIFPHLLSSVGNQEKRLIYRSFLRGEPVGKLATRYRRTRGSIYRIINEMRAHQLLEMPVSFVYNECFLARGAEKTIFANPDSQDKGSDNKKKKVKAPADLPPYLKSLYEVPLLSVEQEYKLFCQYNYLKFRADKCRKKINPKNPLARQIKEVESLLLQANVIKNQIVRANLRLVVSIAKKHVRGPLNLFELISDGNISLMRAVEKFDFARGFRFSTYASWAIMRNFARSVPKERYRLDRFATGHDEILDIAAGLRSYDPQEDNLAELRETIDVLMQHLTPRERTILTEHYGLDEAGRSKTFNQLGKQLGISKERVRQIEIQALEKLREVSDERENT